jgi:hypothetical protein
MFTNAIAVAGREALSGNRHSPAGTRITSKIFWGKGSKNVRTTDSGFRLETSLDDLEYNQIPGLVRHERFDVSGNVRMSRAVDVCFAAKKVRDDIAHMRPPLG